MLGKHSHSPTWLYEGWGGRDLKAEEGERQVGTINMQELWGEGKYFHHYLAITCKERVASVQR